MAVYSGIQKEETFKAAVFRDFFSNSKYAYEPNIDNIDFIVTETKTLKGNIWSRHYLWAESKKGVAEIYDMLTQLVLTSKKTYEKGEHLPPPYIACFDTVKIAFVPFHDILPIFTDNDVNWNITPSNYNTDDFQKTKKKVEKLSKKNIVIFDFDADKKEIVDFINNNLVAGNITSKFQINKNNFVIIYTKWLENVKKSIGIVWDDVKKAGIIDADFFLADLLSRNDFTLKDKLFVILQNNQYKFDKQFTDAGFSLYKEVGFNDNQKAHKAFWDRYERPPLEEYWDYIINRRDLLVPQDIRERKGSFFTPRQWVELSQKYLEESLGEDWQDEYFIWDCAAGTGNLLAGLTNKYNIWASTLDKADVDVMKDRVKNGANLLEDNIFQFDFLNDDFSKLPENLQTIINNPDKRKKLVLYINPPYAEHGNRSTATGTGEHKSKVSIETNVYKSFQTIAKSATRELYAQFFLRIFKEIPDCILASFSTLKYINAPNFSDFREYFKVSFKHGFICPAYTFDNVTGKFPIGFLIWDLDNKNKIKKIKVDVIDENVNKISSKNIYVIPQNKYLIDWFRKYTNRDKNELGSLRMQGNDIQQRNNIAISSIPTENDLVQKTFTYINKYNLIPVSIYFSIRQCVTPTWQNNRDQFLYPNEKWKEDVEFQSDCLTFAIFENDIQSKLSKNHWIPFSSEEINAKGTFVSNFMYEYINGKIKYEDIGDWFTEDTVVINKKIKFTDEAKNVFKAGKELWKYYHKQPSAKVNASLYDIRDYFQGRDKKGKMNSSSNDDIYNELIKKLRHNISLLAEKIEKNVYKYGFLKK